jgi:hypothetical protein
LSWSNWHVEKEIFKRSLFSLICSTLKKFWIVQFLLWLW